tara:strand:+ start:353 stop:526 length:174 start_codon:yes stop_codon:yes gene_type:complete
MVEHTCAVNQKYRLCRYRFCGNATASPPYLQDKYGTALAGLKGFKSKPSWMMVRSVL